MNIAVGSLSYQEKDSCIRGDCSRFYLLLSIIRCAMHFSCRQNCM